MTASKEAQYRVRGPDGLKIINQQECDRLLDAVFAPLKENNTIKLDKDEELWQANPDCEHNIICAPGGGIKCTKCSGWFCW